MKCSITTLALFLSAFIESTTASCAHGTSLAKRKVHTKRSLGGELEKRVEVAKFGYLGANGPAVWQNLETANSACSAGSVQSPIDITTGTTKAVAAGALEFNFPEVEDTEFENLGTTIEVIMEGKNATTTIDGKVFNMLQFHFHTPGEHTLDGEYMPLEMHMVHESEDGAFAVVAVPFHLCEADGSTPLLNQLLPKMDAIKEPGSVTETGPLDFAALISLLDVQPFSNYGGSLTTPPCTEGIQFYVATQTLPINVKTFNLMKSIVGFNSRFVQNTIGTGNVLSL